ncbi:TPA: glycosyltransferase family 2 protein [Vibrio parahaemolyticus]|nr:glycosyltransferase family 2 protein [Vibrio parahaemolyticus]
MSFKNNNKKLSIVIPFYNSERSIDNVLRSMDDNSLDLVELIFVNDGSVDNSENLIRARLDNSTVDFKIISQTNSGVSSARNTGLQHCKGEYLIFLDSDDAIRKNALCNVIGNLNSGLDVYVYEYVKFSSYQDFQENSFLTKNRVDCLSRDIYIDYIYGKLIEKVSVCSCIYRRDFIINNNLLFDTNLAFAEDQLFLINAIIAGSVKYFEGQVFLGYYSNPDSVTSKYNERRFEAIEVFESLKVSNENLSNALNYRVNLELVGILRLYVRDHSLKNSLTYYLKKVKNKIKGVDKDVNIKFTIDYNLFVNCGLLYVFLYKAYYLTKGKLWKK